MFDHKVLLLLSMLITGSLASCVIADTGEITLKMGWEVGPPTQHVLLYEVDLRGTVEDSKGGLKHTTSRTTSKVSYTQTISEHPEGLLVRQTKFKVLESELDVSPMTISQMQVVLVKISAVIFASRPDYIMSPTGEFVRLHEFDKYSEVQRERLEDAIGRPVDELGQMVSNVTKASLNEESLQIQIKHDLSLILDMDNLSISRDQTIKKNITQAYASKKEKDYIAEGQLSFIGEHACNWKTKSGCVELRFNSNDKNLYDFQLVIESDTLFPHSYQAKSELSAQTERGDLSISKNSTIRYTHTVERM